MLEPEPIDEKEILLELFNTDGGDVGILKHIPSGIAVRLYFGHQPNHWWVAMQRLRSRVHYAKHRDGPDRFLEAQSSSNGSLSREEVRDAMRHRLQYIAICEKASTPIYFKAENLFRIWKYFLSELPFPEEKNPKTLPQIVHVFESTTSNGTGVCFSISE